MYQELFKQQEDVFKVIANQKRLEIIHLLTHGELSVSEMVDMLGISQSNISQHLSYLRQAKVVKTRKEGTTVYYKMSDPRIAQACNLIRQFLKENDLLSAATEDLTTRDTNELYPLVQDPVCGMRMIASEAPLAAKRAGMKIYFCAAGCKKKFTNSPNKYLSKAKIS